MNCEVRKITFDDGQVRDAFVNKQKSAAEILDYTAKLANSKHMMEWRLDCFENATQMNHVIELANEINENFPDLYLMITFRSQKNGGHTELDREDGYLNLVKILIEFQLSDAVDIELNHTSDRVEDLIACAHRQNMHVSQSEF